MPGAAHCAIGDVLPSRRATCSPHGLAAVLEEVAPLPLRHGDHDRGAVRVGEVGLDLDLRTALVVERVLERRADRASAGVRDERGPGRRAALARHDVEGVGEDESLGDACPEHGGRPLARSRLTGRRRAQETACFASQRIELSIVGHHGSSRRTRGIRSMGCRRSPVAIGYRRAVEVGRPFPRTGCALVRRSRLPPRRETPAVDAVDESAQSRHGFALDRNRYLTPFSVKASLQGSASDPPATSLRPRVDARPRTARPAPRAAVQAALRRDDDHHARGQPRAHRAGVRRARSVRGGRHRPRARARARGRSPVGGCHRRWRPLGSATPQPRPRRRVADPGQCASRHRGARPDGHR